MDLAASFHQHAGLSCCPSLSSRMPRSRAPFFSGICHTVTWSRAWKAAALSRSAFREVTRSPGFPVGEHLPVHGQLTVAVQDDPQGILSFHQPAGQGRIVVEDRVLSHQDAVVDAPELVGISPGLLIGDPFGISGAVAIFPSRVMAYFRATKGRPVFIQCMNTSFCRLALSASTPRTHFHPRFPGAGQSPVRPLSGWDRPPPPPLF